VLFTRAWLFERDDVTHVIISFQGLHTKL
jgi:hypothetical protein